MTGLRKAVAIAVGASTLASCAPSPPRPSALAIVESVVVSPSSVAVGGQFTVTITAVDDIEIVELQPGWAAGPSGADIDFSPVCVVDPFVPDANRRVVVDITCTVPEMASNGGWSLPVSVVDFGGGVPYATAYADFTVTGGSSDYSPPVVSHTVVPENPVAGENFHVITLIEDETGPISRGSGYDQSQIALIDGASRIVCTATVTQPSPTSWVRDYACVPEAGAVPGNHTAVRNYVDGLNKYTRYVYSVDIS